MKITKYEHACVVIEKNDHKIVIDPGVWTSDLPQLTNVDAVIITHEHADHFSHDHIQRIYRHNPSVRVFATPSIAATDNDFMLAKPGEKIHIGEFKIEFFGGDHAPIIDGISPCKNVGVLINQTFAYAGDSFSTPPVRPRVLATPASAPWMKIAESMLFIETVRPQMVFPTHNILLSPIGEDLADTWLEKGCGMVGAEYVSLKPGESIEA